MTEQIACNDIYLHIFISTGNRNEFQVGVFEGVSTRQISIGIILIIKLFKEKLLLLQIL